VTVEWGKLVTATSGTNPPQTSHTHHQVTLWNYSSASNFAELPITTKLHGDVTNRNTKSITGTDERKHNHNHLVVLEELEYGEHDVVDVAEAGRLALLRVVQAPGPVDCDVVAVVELDGAADGGAGVGLAEAVEAVEDGAVLADVEALEQADLVLLRLRRDGAEEVDVVVGVEAAEVAVAGGVGAVHLHLVEEAVARQQRVRHPDAVRLHRVALPVVVVAHLRVVESSTRAASARRGRPTAGSCRRSPPTRDPSPPPLET